LTYETLHLRAMSTKQIRFEVPVPPDRFADIERLAERIRVSPRDLARIAIARDTLRGTGEGNISL